MHEWVAEEVARVTTCRILEIIGGCLRDEERQDAYEEILACVIAGFECFHIQNNRFERLLKPGIN